MIGMRQSDFTITDAPEAVAEKIRMVADLSRRPAVVPSGTDVLLDDRRRERERELREEGW